MYRCTNANRPPRRKQPGLWSGITFGYSVVVNPRVDQTTITLRSWFIYQCGNVLMCQCEPFGEAEIDVLMCWFVDVLINVPMWECTNANRQTRRKLMCWCADLVMCWFAKRPLRRKQPGSEVEFNSEILVGVTCSCGQPTGCPDDLQRITGGLRTVWYFIYKMNRWCFNFALYNNRVTWWI